MRIGFFTDGFLPQPNGVSTSVFEAARELERRGHEVFIVAPRYPGFVDKNLNVIRLTSVKIFEHPETRIALNIPDKGLRKIMSMDFDLIHGHSGGPVTLLGLQVARAKKIPYVVTYHTLWNRYTHYFLKGKVVTPKMIERATKIFGNRVDCLVAPTDRVERELKSYGIKKPISVIPSGINTDEFREAKKGFLREKLNLKDEPILLFVGRLGKEKDVRFLMDSFNEVYKREKDVHFVLAGDGPDKKKLQNLAERLGLAENVHFLGNVLSTDIPRVYKDTTVFIFSSTTETQGLVVPEALSAGVPVIANDDPAFECVENGKNGYLVKAGDTKEFALKVLSIVKNADLRKEMSAYAIESSAKFSVKETVDSLETVYFGLLDKYNKESVARIMSKCENNERNFVTNWIFWATVLFLRATTFLFYKQGTYPLFHFGTQVFYHSTVGVVLILIFLALIVKRKKSGIFSLIALGVGAAFVMDEVWSIFTLHATISDYWNPINIIPVVIFGIAPLFFSKIKLDDRAKFYIYTREQKHTNPENPKVTVVVPAYNEGAFMEPTLKSLLNQTYKNFELLVVDNNSTDNTAEVAKRFGARVVLQKTKGVAAARQAGFFEARGEIIVSTDADTVAPEDWLAKIVKAYEKNNKMVGFGGLNALYSGPVTARAAGRYLFPVFWVVDKFMNGGWNMAGFNMSAKREAFLEIGGFDPTLKMGEDIDLSKKLRTVGEVRIDLGLLVYSSGRRYQSGLLSGLMSYAPWWISKNIFHQDKVFEFKNVRSDHAQSSHLTFLPWGIVVIALGALFSAAR